MPAPPSESTESESVASRNKTAAAQKSAPAVTAVEMGARQREISVSEFFTKNRHLLGFDNPRKALLTCVKEAVDNSLDACEEAGILPDVTVKLEVVANGPSPVAPSQATRFRITVSDNGPGIVRQQIPRVFAKLLYGSKFHRMRMSRGQQGIGISAAGMYGQLTTGKPVKVISRTGPRAAAHYFEVQIDTKKNEPLVHENKQIEWAQPQGTEVVLEVVANGPSPVAPSQATRFRITVSDNGPGIVRQQIPRVFAKLLYGSKFHRMRMSRGQQGIGISAAGMYGQLTTGKPVKVISRTGPRAAAHYFEVQIDTKKNEPLVHENKQIEWAQPQGTEVVLEVEGRYQKGRASVDEWLEQTSIANPHVQLTYHTPEGEQKQYPRTYHELPPSPKEIKPHPYGIEFGALLKMLQDTKSHTVASFLASDFCRVSPALADEICKAAKLSPNTKPREVKPHAAETLYKTIQTTKIMAPPTNCISPIGEKAILSGLYKQIKGEFYTAVSRPPAVYRGYPFVIEAGLAFGKGPEEALKPQQAAVPLAEGEDHGNDTEQARVIRYANRVPLLYQQSACATFKAVLSTTWRNYGVSQSRGALPWDWHSGRGRKKP